MLRLKYLDGLRGVAIALVLLFHAYARWPELVPFGDRFAHAPIVSQGMVGVQLFFLISGFVIFMTLERSSGFGDFMKRRWLRLWPAMLMVSLFVFATASLFTRPAGVPTLRDLLPGLTLVDPDWWAWGMGSPQGVLEGAFWSLFVEMKFYVVAGALYFVAGPRPAIGVLVAMFAVAVVAGHYRNPVLLEVTQFLGAWHWGWFAAGALFYKGLNKPWLMAAGLALSFAAASRLPPECRWMGAGVSLLFAVAHVSRHVQAFLSLPPLLFLGAISYPLYLVHENMLVSMIIDLGKLAPWIPPALLPALPVCAVILIGWFFAARIEPDMRNAIQRLTMGKRISTAG